jgi:hypothetical protein
MTLYIVASRDNIRSNVLECFPPILKDDYNDFNNKILSSKFSNENEIILWLENTDKIDSIKSNNKYNKNIRRNVLSRDDIQSLNQIRLLDEKSSNKSNKRNKKINYVDKLFGIYSYDKESSKIEYMYSLRKKYGNESYTIMNENGKKKFSLFKRVHDNKLTNFNMDDFEYSSDTIVISGQLYEGIYPLNLEIGKNNNLVREYIDFVMDIHKNNKNSNDSPRDIYIVDDLKARKLHLSLISKLKMIEKLLIDNISRKDSIFEPSNNSKRNDLIKYTINLLKNRKSDTNLIDRILPLIVDPILFNDEIFQIRFENNLITWHKNYSDILIKYSIMPSKKFTKLILDFDISDLKKMYQSYDNIMKITINLEEYLNLDIKKNSERKPIVNKKRKFKKLQATFK